MDSAGRDKENASIVNTKKNISLRRPPKCIRLSDRWPVLSRIIRSTKSGTALLDSTSSTDLLDDPNSYQDQDCTRSVRHSNDTSILPSAGYSQRVLHPLSPKFPSPLSGVCPVGRLLLARHNYPHRGHSQSALYLQRDFWRKRKCEWDDYEFLLYRAGLTLEEAYGGTVEDENGSSHALPPHLKTGPWNGRSNPAPRESSETKLAVPVFLNYSTYPRLGDLSSIRDPFLLSVDTWFSDFPLWTLSKLFWIFDVNYRSGHSARSGMSAQNVNAFTKDFDMGNSSVDAVSVSETEFSDTTLVETNSILPPSPGDHLKGAIRCQILPEHSLLYPISLDSVRNTDAHAKTWEVDWFSRWEVLYNQVSLAADIVASAGNPAPSTNASKDAARIILTTSNILYDPLRSNVDTWKADEQERESDYSVGTRTDVMHSMEEDEEDYGRVIPLSESLYRIGAQVDPFSMFATAFSEPSVTLNTGLTHTGTPFHSKDYADEISDDLQQLAIYS
ncbi:hypothetical protein A7U60_g4417 [Sanghuangporus baumii]|uniref:Uncharacterized protein n=1 Tax=Sanghuangporus baumii TaxID=108892 RepID=A0A9Q5HYI7_SANBA|nr:hypothetical protein A7U60_g4417 [Sanghuangporus baumii]